MRVSTNHCVVKNVPMPNVVVHICNPSILEAKAGGSLQVRGQHGEFEDSLNYKVGTLSPNKHTEKECSSPVILFRIVVGKYLIVYACNVSTW